MTHTVRLCYHLLVRHCRLNVSAAAPWTQDPYPYPSSSTLSSSSFPPPQSQSQRFPPHSRGPSARQMIGTTATFYDPDAVTQAVDVHAQRYQQWIDSYGGSQNQNSFQNQGQTVYQPLPSTSTAFSFQAPYGSASSSSAYRQLSHHNSNQQPQQQNQVFGGYGSNSFFDEQSPVQQQPYTTANANQDVSQQQRASLSLSPQEQPWNDDARTMSTSFARTGAAPTNPHANTGTRTSPTATKRARPPTKSNTNSKGKRPRKAAAPVLASDSETEDDGDDYGDDYGGGGISVGVGGMGVGSRGRQGRL